MAESKIRKPASDEMSEDQLVDIKNDNETAPAQVAGAAQGEEIAPLGSGAPDSEGAADVLPENESTAAVAPDSDEPQSAVESPEPAAPPADSEQPARGMPGVASTPHRGGFLPMFLGGVIAAALGAGGAIYAVPRLPPQLAALLPLPPATAGDTAAKLADQGARLETLTKELAALKVAAPPVPDLSGVKSALDEATAANRALGDRVGSLEGRIVALENRPAVSGEISPEASAALQGQIDALKQDLSRIGTDTVSQDAIAAAAAEAKARIDAAEAQAAELRAQSEAAAKRAMAQAAAARIGAAFDAGAPLAPALADAEAAGIAVPDLLKGEVPSLAALQASFPDAARLALAAARKAAAGEKLTDRIGAFLMTQTGARSLEPHAGNDPDAVLSRAQGAVTAGDLATAVTEIGMLPEPGQAALADWVGQAKVRLSAAQAVADVTQSVK